MASQAPPKSSQRSVPDHFQTFELSIERIGETYRVRVPRSPAGPRPPVEIDRAGLDPRDPAEQGNSEPARDIRRRPVDRHDLRQLGEQLFRAVFVDAIVEVFRTSIERVRRQGAGLRVCVRLDQAPELATLPWEAMWDPIDRAFLADSADLPIVRSLDVAAEKPTIEPVEPPLRVSALLPDPRGEGKLDGAGEWHNIQTQLTHLLDQELIEADKIQPPTLDGLGRRIADGPCHVLHVVAHGAPGGAGSGGLLKLENASGGSDPVTGGDLARALERRTPPRLVILNACHGARAAVDDAFDGMAQHLLSRGIPAVVAMRTTISDAAAVSFATALYGELAKGKTIEAAMVEARRRLSLGRHRTEWATPVLYLRRENVRILEAGSADRKVSAKRRGGRLRHLAVGLAAAAAAVVTALLIWRWTAQGISPCPTPPGLNDLRFVKIDTGSINLGDSKVTVEEAFCIADKELSRRDWLEVMGGDLPRPDWPLEWPMTDVTPDEADAFLKQLGERDREVTYRLPTANEWEFAARAESKSAYYFGSDPSELHAFGNCNNFLGHDGYDGPAPVGSFRPNQWRLYDIHGNVAEWVLWSLDGAPQVNEEGERRALRLGGSFENVPANCSFSGSRSDVKYEVANRMDTGFRIVRELTTKQRVAQ